MTPIRYIVEAKDLNEFKYCPYCGKDMLSVYLGDYRGQTECLYCEDELEFTILEEYRSRNPVGFEKMIRR